MKQSILMAALAFFALVGCTKADQATPQESSQDAPRVTLNLSVAPMDAFGTKATTKQAWDGDDYLYLFFAPVGASSYTDLKNVIVKYNEDTEKWVVDTDSQDALDHIDASGKVLAIYTIGTKRSIEGSGPFHLGDASANAANAYGLSMSQVTDYTFSASEVGVTLNLARIGVTQITVTGITNDTNNQWVLYNCGTGAEVFSGIGQLSAKFEKGAFTESALLTPMDEVPGINSGSGAVTFYVANIDDLNKDVRLILYNTKTEKSYIRILDDTKVSSGKAYTIAAPTLNSDGDIDEAKSWIQGFLVEYTADSEEQFSYTSPKPVAKYYNSELKWGYAIFTKATLSSSIFWRSSSDNNLKTATFQKGVTKLDSNMFRKCAGLLTATLPSTITKIGSYAFRDCNNAAAKIICLPSDPPVLESDVFKDTHANLKIYVPDGSVTNYKTNWSALLDKIHGISEM